MDTIQKMNDVIVNRINKTKIYAHVCVFVFLFLDIVCVFQ
jgi:hypothetical protein